MAAAPARTPVAALYARMERADASAEVGLELQLKICDLAAKQRGLAVTERLGDLAASGDNMLRPGLQHLLTSVMEQRVDAVVVTGIAQLTYRAADWQFIDDLFKRANVQLFTVLPQTPDSAPGRAA